MGSYERTLLKVIDSDSPVDPRQLMGKLSLFQEDGTPITLEQLLGGGGGGIPDPVTFESLMPYAGVGVTDYAVDNPGETFDHPGFYVNGGQILLNGAFTTAVQDNDVLMNLPPELRPRKTRAVQVETAGGTKTAYFNPDGTVKRAGGGIMGSFCVLGGAYLL